MLRREWNLLLVEDGVDNIEQILLHNILVSSVYSTRLQHILMHLSVYNIQSTYKTLNDASRGVLNSMRKKQHCILYSCYLNAIAGVACPS